MGWLHVYSGKLGFILKTLYPCINLFWMFFPRLYSRWTKKLYTYLETSQKSKQHKRIKVTNLVSNKIVEYKMTVIIKRIWVSSILKSSKEFKTTFEKEYKIHDVEKIVKNWTTLTKTLQARAILIFERFSEMYTFS